MKDKILKLIESQTYEDVVLGIELSFDLRFDEYLEVWEDRFRLNCKYGLISAFSRRKIGYAIGTTGTLYKRNSSRIPPDNWVNLGIKED